MIRSLLLAAALLPAPVLAQTIAITGGKLVIGDGSAPIEEGTVIVTNGRVTAAGKGIAIPAGAQTVNAKGKWVTPGIVAGFTRLGLSGLDAVDGANDTAANGAAFQIAIDVAEAINPDHAAIAINRAAGVTRAIVSPDAANGAIFGGHGAVIDTASDGDPVTRAKAFVFLEYGESGARRAGGSRPALHAGLRAAFAEARMPGGDNPLLRKADAQALLPVLNGQIKLVIHAESANDIRAVLALKKEFPTLDLVLVGAAEGWRMATELAAARIPVLASALTDLPNSFEQLGSTQSNIGRMKAAGVSVGIGMIDDSDTRQAQLSTQYAGNLVALTRVPGASGLDWNAAFAAISSKPAEIIGLGAEIGSLRPGRRGDVVIWDGDPLEVTSGVEAVWIDGVKQSLSTRQTRLRDRYKTPGEGHLPKAYDR